MALLSQGTQLFAIDPETNELLDIGCVTSINNPSATAESIDTTCLNSTTRTYLNGLPTPSVTTFGLQADPSNAAHVRLFNLVGGENLKWVIGWSDGPVDADGEQTAKPTVESGEFNLPKTRSWLEFEGGVTNFPIDWQINLLVASTVSVQVSGKQKLTSKESS